MSEGILEGNGISGAGPQPAAHLEPRDPGEHQIEQYHVGPGCLSKDAATVKEVDGLSSVAKQTQAIVDTAMFQRFDSKPSIEQTIFDQHDLQGLAGRFWSWEHHVHSF